MQDHVKAQLLIERYGFTGAYYRARGSVKAEVARQTEEALAIQASPPGQEERRAFMPFRYPANHVSRGVI